MSCKMSDYQCSFSDISDDDLVSATQFLLNEYVSSDLWNDAANDELLVAASQAYDVCDADEGARGRSAAAAGTSGPTRFGESLTEQDLNNIQQGRFPKNTVDNATWAVTLFGDWRGERNRRCVEENDVNLVYINKPFASMSDDEMNYCVPFFLAEIRKRNGDPYPATTLRQIVLSLQKFLELQGRHVKFISDVKFRAIRDTLDALMKERAQAGVGMHVRRAEIITEEMENTLWEKVDFMSS